ncbi:hypothetical protein THICB1_140041 [Thiomonas arsenitoxydans]|uniref:Uncharacterized protein n=1 Tax=Thiomonas arsenitoxydans (strain DSM 22701 / CIP 110005 / 3As) TaxID=426114 RepID=A0ABM9T378_THIA3|nr:hypothetical protein THICB6_150044 [Thiomonas arsenitoxydans]CQR30250.1 hypothetical protein THICB1_140041 [Thiomonas arsenitoxydans]CQR41153.1 hypothetical protein ACO3_80015 [Thiomonas arsenitoxydans]
MRCQHDGARHGVGKARGVQEGDGAAVAVPEQPIRRGDAQRPQQCGQHLLGLAMHEVRVPQFVRRTRCRPAVARAAVDEPSATYRLAELTRKVLPHRHRSETLVQEDEQRPVTLGTDPPHLDVDWAAVPVDPHALIGSGHCGMITLHASPPRHAA